MSMFLHCPYRQTSLIQQALVSDKIRVAFFLGAGCPVSIQIEEKPLIPDILGLTTKVCDELNTSIKHSDHKKNFECVIKRLNNCGNKNPNIEEILTAIRTLTEASEGGAIDGLTNDALNKLDLAICNITTNIVKARLPHDKTPYHQLATWIGSIRRSYPVEIFTTNYDLLMEQALEERCVPYFDGFVGSNSTFFDLPSIEQDEMPPRWARLWKVHGSINWWRSENSVYRNSNQNHSNGSEINAQQMIYPSHLKYDQSRRMPYLAMLDRLKLFLSNSQAVLITCGYSFSDQHLNEVILQGLKGNPSALCFGLQYGKLSSVSEAVTRASKQQNFSLLSADGAVIGTRSKKWHTEIKNDNPIYELAVSKISETGRKFLLGDFAVFGEFLAWQWINSKVENKNET